MKIDRTYRCGLLLVLAILTTLLLSSCSGDKGTDVKVDEGPDRTTPNGLLLSFAQSYEEKDLEGYVECLDEDFLFVFTADIADSLGLPPEGPWWGITEDVNSTQIMFENPNVTDIAFSYEVAIPWGPYVEVREDTIFSGVLCRLDPLIEVTTSVGSSEDPILTYRVDSSYLDVVVVPDRFTEGLWCILRIEESKKQMLQAPIASEPLATEACTWGAVKSKWQ